MWTADRFITAMMTVHHTACQLVVWCICNGVCVRMYPTTNERTERSVRVKHEIQVELLVCSSCLSRLNHVLSAHSTSTVFGCVYTFYIVLYGQIRSLFLIFFLTFRFESSVDRIVNDMFWLEIQYHIRSKGERNGREWETKNIMCK